MNMILREFFYFNNTESNMTNDDRYDPSADDSIVNKKDTRKIRLTLKQINKLRKASDMHSKEHAKDVDFISKMYVPPTPPATA
jgi:hypothetical protein